MRQLWTVIRFELNSYIKNKSYVIMTIVLALILAVGLCIPSFFMDDKDSDKKEGQTSEQSSEEDSDKDLYVIYDKSGVVKDLTFVNQSYGEDKWELVSDQKTLEDKVQNGNAKAGFIVETPTSYEYVVNNSKMYDHMPDTFNEILSNYYRVSYMEENHIDVQSMQKVINTPIENHQKILGKDSVGSYAYTYILIFMTYFLIIFYGQMIAVGVTSEKSNRAIELLITSSKPDYLIFGKVIAGAIASILQVTIILGSAIISYKVNAHSLSKLLGGMLGSLFDIPAHVLVVFGVFVLLGFLFYSFLYGGLGALVSKTEDISKSIGPVMMIFIIGFFIAIYGLNDPEGMLVRVASFIPFTSSYTMLIRVSMGTVSVIEIIISAAILVASCILAGFIGAKIYRMGTLHYGNPMKLSNVLKRIFREKQ